MMRNFLKIMLLFNGILFVSCSKDDDSGPATSNLTLEIIGLESLTNGASYEGWLVVDDVLISTGKFTEVSTSMVFTVVKENLDKATEFILSVEPPNDSDPNNPSKSRLLNGKFNGDIATVSINEVISDLSNVSGKFVLQTPTDTDTTNDEFGIWFVDPTGAENVAGLTLPKLASGWKYEGWVIFNDIPVTTGTFSDADGFDDASPYSGNGTAPNYPGEDFLNSAPQGLTFPQDGDVRGKAVVISIEPSPDYDQATPFMLKPLKGNASQNTSPALGNLIATNNSPFGRVLR